MKCFCANLLHSFKVFLIAAAVLSSGTSLLTYRNSNKQIKISKWFDGLNISNTLIFRFDRDTVDMGNYVYSARGLPPGMTFNNRSVEVIDLDPIIIQALVRFCNNADWVYNAQDNFSINTAIRTYFRNWELGSQYTLRQSKPVYIAVNVWYPYSHGWINTHKNKVGPVINYLKLEQELERRVIGVDEDISDYYESDGSNE